MRRQLEGIPLVLAFISITAALTSYTLSFTRASRSLLSAYRCLAALFLHEGYLTRSRNCAALAQARVSDTSKDWTQQACL